MIRNPRDLLNENSNKNKEKQVFTLHIGANKTAPVHAFGCLRCILSDTAPPIDCPKRKLGRELNSGFAATKKLKVYQYLKHEPFVNPM